MPFGDFLRQFLKIFTNSISMEFVLIPAGRFTKGRLLYEFGKHDYEDPQVEISKAFYMGKYEVTQGQWRAVLGNNPSYFKDCGDDCPVESVSWHDVQEFISKLNQREGTDKYRLPTEAEWEYACQAGSQSAYGFGEDAGNLGEYGWYSVNSGGRTHPVGQKRPNGLGLYDMSGNVSEWVSDWYDEAYYQNSLKNDPPGPSVGHYKVVRGGSWGDDPRHLRASRRFGVQPSNGVINIGFRLGFPPQ